MGTLLGPISPTVLDGRGSAVSCSSANLPAGLRVDPTTCQISGTPTAEFYGSPTITAANSVGNTTATLSISVIPGVPVLRYSESLIGTVGKLITITPSLDTKGGALTECKSSAALPSGLSIDGTDCRVYGTPQTAIKGTYTITAKNAGGSGIATLYIGIEVPAYNCINNGYTGPSGTVTSVTSCYTDCAKVNKCGGIKYYPNICDEKTPVQVDTKTTPVILSYKWKNICDKYYECVTPNPTSFHKTLSNGATLWCYNYAGGGSPADNVGYPYEADPSNRYCEQRWGAQCWHYGSSGSFTGCPSWQELPEICGFSANYYDTWGKDNWWAGGEYVPFKITSNCYDALVPVYGEPIIEPVYEYYCK